MGKNGALEGSLTPAGRDRYGIKSNNSAKDTKYDSPLILLPFVPYAVLTAAYLGVSGVHAGYRKVMHSKMDKERSEEETDKKTGFKIKKNQEMTKKQDMARVNPDYSDGSRESSHNCMVCTTAYDIRRRGYDVTANKTLDGFTFYDLKKWYPKAKMKTVSAKNEIGDESYKNLIKNAEKVLLSQGEGARGNMMVSWPSGGGHSVVYEIENNKVVVRDCQSNKVHDLKYYQSGGITSLSYIRLDNIDFDPKAIKEVLK